MTPPAGYQIASLIHLIFRLLQFFVFARVIISWIPVNRYHPAARFIYNVTEPMLRPFRAVVRVGPGGIDFSPMILLVVLFVGEQLIVSLVTGGR
jgi:YggT family protein